MRGPFPLQNLTIGMHVPCAVRGVFCLAKKPGQVCLVGRADNDLRAALKTYITKFPFFSFETALSPEECWVIHCRLYHKYADSGTLEDRLHPAADKPGQKCPVCGI
jgi:hypothetical protein